MIFTLFHKILPPIKSCLLVFLNNNKIFLLNKKGVIDKKKVFFCSTSLEQLSNSNHQTNIKQKNNFNKYFFSNDLINVRNYQDSFLLNCSRYSFLIPHFSHSNKFENNSNIQQQSTAVIKESYDFKGKELHNLNFEELLETINLFFHTLKKPFTQYQNDMLKNLDSELEKRANNLSRHELLQIFKVLYNKKYKLKLNFCWKRFMKLAKTLKQLTIEELVFFLYISYKWALIIPKERKFDFFKNVNNFIPQLNATELGIVSLGLCHNNLRISHIDLIKNIINAAVSQIENLTSADVVSVSRVIFKKALFPLGHSVLDFQEKLVPYLPKYKTYALPFLALSGVKLFCLNFTFFDEILKLMKANFNECNALALESITMLFVIFNKKDDEFLEMAIKKFLENKNCCSSVLVAFVKHLMCLEVYDKNLIEVVMSEKYVNYVLKMQETNPSLDLLYINACLRIDYPTCDVKLLDKDICKTLKKFYYSKIPFHFDKTISTTNEKVINKFYARLEKHYGPEFVSWRNPLKHHKFIIMMRFDKNLKAQPIPEEYNRNTEMVITPLCDDHFWVPLIIVLTNFNGSQINYAYKTPFRQLKSIGYHPVEVNYKDWLTHLKKRTEYEYFENQIKYTLQKELSNF